MEWFDPYRRLYTFAQPERILFGFEAYKSVGEEAKDLTTGRRAQIITDKGIIRIGLLDGVKMPLEEAGFEVEVWDKPAVEPHEETIEEGVRDIKGFNPDIVIGFGGGSSIDTAKLIAGRMTNPKELKEYFSTEVMRGVFKNRPKPILAIPTTAGTGAENTNVAVVSLKDVPGKPVFRDPKLIPLRALVDPTLTLQLPPKITASTGIDALAHLVDPYLSVASNPLSEMLAIHGVRSISTYLPKAVYFGSDLEARWHMMLQATLGGLALNYAAVSEGHIYSHMIGGKYHIPHGVAVGIALPYTLEYNIPVSADKLRLLAEAMGENVKGLTVREAAYKAIFAIKRLMEQVGLPTQLSQVEGAKKEDIAQLSKNLLTYSSRSFKFCCRRRTTEKDAKKMLERMWEGKIGT